MALKGNLRDFTTTQLLNLIHLARKSGTLTVQGSQHASVSFKDGKLVYAEMDGAATGLSQILSQAGKLTPDQSNLIEQKMQGRSDKQLGHRLIQAKLVTQNDIIQSIREHVLSIVYKIFTWAEGTFSFNGMDSGLANRITIPIDLEIVIIEGSRRLQESEHLLEELPDLDACLKFVDQPDKKLRNINLTVEEWRIISYINPQNTIKQIADANKLSDFEVRRAVYGMMQAGIVEPIITKKAAPADSGYQSPRARAPQASVSERRGVVNKLIDRIRNL